MHNKILTSFKVRTAQWGRSNFLFQDSTSVEKETQKTNWTPRWMSKKKGNVDNEMIIMLFSRTFVFSRKCLSTYRKISVTMKFIVLPDHPASENPPPNVLYLFTFLLGQRLSKCLVETHTHITSNYTYSIFNKQHMCVPSWHVKTPCTDHVTFLLYAPLAHREHESQPGDSICQSDLLLFWRFIISMEHQTQQKTWRYWFWSTPGSPPNPPWMETTDTLFVHR